MWLEANTSAECWLQLISRHAQPWGIVTHPSLGMGSENDDFWSPNPIQE